MGKKKRFLLLTGENHALAITSIEVEVVFIAMTTGRRT